uniref:Uncharacterized protein n=1 Tax=Arion vulgaris TaxID=1028688 RepID=A0A0B7AUM9_9EUPU
MLHTFDIATVFEMQNKNVCNRDMKDFDRTQVCGETVVTITCGMSQTHGKASQRYEGNRSPQTHRETVVTDTWRNSYHTKIIRKKRR